MKTLKKLNYYVTKHLMLVALFVLAFTVSVFAQTPILVKGIVTDVMGMSIPGATVLIKGTTNGTITDFDGNFTLDCDLNDTLSVSFVGYLTEEYVAQEGVNLNVLLIEDIAKIGEVVVVGYGTMRKSDLTGAITSVSAEELHKGVVTTTEQVLQGKVAGLTVIKGSGDPTAGATMRLRGGTSLSASSSPLVVVDGIPGVDINTVQPSDIESIDVLKDASSSAIYGSRGANGVIIITTSKPKVGQKIDYNSYFAWGKVANHIDMLSASEYRALPDKDAAISIIDEGASTDWIREMEQTGFTKSHDISISAATEKSGLRASVNYLDSKGVIRTSELKRIGLNVSAYTHGLNDKLRIDLGTHSTFDKYHPVNTGIFESAYNQNPTIAVYDSTGAYNISAASREFTPIEQLETDIHDNTTNRILGYAKADLEIINGLNIALNLSNELNSRRDRIYVPITAQRAQFEQSAIQRLSEYNTQQLETYATYVKELNSNHRFNIMGGYTYLNTISEYVSAKSRNYVTDITTYNNLEGGNLIALGDAESNKKENTLISFFGRLNYSLKNKYVFTGTLRRDGSSKFGKNEKWGLFPSAAAAWTVSSEPFMASTGNWLNNLKLRFGYGITGSQDAIEPYKTLGLYGTSSGGAYYDAASDSWNNSYRVTQNENPDLKWETTTQYNLGMDFSLFNKLSGTLELYNKLTNDLIYLYDVPADKNFYGQTLANVGDLSNKGIELSLSSTIIQKTDFSWDVSLSMARNILKVEKLSNDAFQADSILMGDLIGINGLTSAQSQILYEGGSVGTFFVPVCSGIDSTGQFLDKYGRVISSLHADSIQNEDVGSAQPKFTLGFNTTFKYKNFDLGISTYGIFGQKVFNATAMVLYAGGRIPAQNAPVDVLDRGITDQAVISDYWVETASFFRIQSVTLGYTFKLNTPYVSNLRLYVSGENLWVFTNYSGIDPEINIENYDAEGKLNVLTDPGIDRFNVYPKARIFSFGLNVTF
ncbi:MAG: TonB-dependent receptor [Salinivirgaceae bacterium]|jgi:TonB-linked SusC/RagA family outer membrane protein|nr:TonB-dependent receptor [Salinivirgaceae bacterium]